MTEARPLSEPLCPACEKPVRRRPTSRSVIDRVKKLFTSKRPHHCRACGWYGWLEVADRPNHAVTWTVEREPPDLEAVDEGMVADLAPARPSRGEPHS